MNKNYLLLLAFLISATQTMLCSNVTLEELKKALAKDPQPMITLLEQEQLSAEDKTEICLAALDATLILLKEKDKVGKKLYGGRLTSIRSEQRYMANVISFVGAACGAVVLALAQEPNTPSSHIPVIGGMAFGVLIAGKIHYDISQAEQEDKPIEARIRALNKIVTLSKKLNQ